MVISREQLGPQMYVRSKSNNISPANDIFKYLINKR